MPASHSVLRSRLSANHRKANKPVKPAKQPERFTLRYLPLAVSAALGTLALPSLAGPEGGLFI